MTHTLFKAQDAILEKVFSNLARLAIPNCILAGGTALARFYLHHRVSYDLDFFVGGNFSPEKLSVALGRIGINLSDVRIESGGAFAHQLHGYANIDESIVKISFVEDVYEGMWPKKNFGNIDTEEIGGLYHRKLRTISGSGYGRNTSGARQTARDLFDVYVLDKEVQPLHEFLDEANRHGANYPQDALCANILTMPWFDLMDEFAGLELLSPYTGLSLIGDIKPVLVGEAVTIQRMPTMESQLETWERARRMAFWDQGMMDFARWSAAFKSGKTNVIRQSINHMRAADLIALVGRQKFIKDWPSLRDEAGLNENKKAILDAAWGLYMAGDATFPVSAAVTRFHPKKLGTLRVLAKTNGQDSIYRIAQKTGRNYRRVYDDIMDFVEDGLVIITTEVRNGRISKVPRLRGLHVA